MPSWDEATGLSTSPKDPFALVEVDPSVEVARTVTERNDRVRKSIEGMLAALAGVTPPRTFRGDGPEPPADVKFLRYPVDAGEKPVQMGRCPQGGWWWIGSDVKDLRNVTMRRKGWPWREIRVAYPNEWEDITPSADGESGATADVVYTLNGSEPPPHVVRLRLVKSEPGESQTDLARCPKGGWWWCEADEEAPDGNPGWTWNARDGRLGRQLVVKYPQLTHDEVSMAHNLASALPRDEEWYQVAVRREDDCPIWAYCDGDGDTETTTGWENPG